MSMKSLKNTRGPRVDVLEPRRLFAALTPGLSVSSTIAAASEVDTYTLNVTAGKTLVVALGETTTAAFDPQVQLRDPTGAVVRTDSNEVGVFYSVTAAKSGTYELRVSDAGANDTGGYTLTAFTPGSNFSYGEEGAEAESGRRRAAGVGPGDLDVWTIDTQKGQYIATEVTENKPGDPVQLG